MFDERLPWRRSWFLAGDTPTLDTDYLAEQPGPDQHSILETTGLGELPGAGLLAEPGMGKTTELTVLHEHFLARGINVIYQDLSEVGNSDQLRAFFTSALLTDWLTDARRTGEVLLLDSLDQCLSSDSSAAAALSQILGRLLGEAEFKADEFTHLLDVSPDTINVLAPYLQRHADRVTVDVFTLRQHPTVYNRLDKELQEALGRYLRSRRLKVFISCRAAQWPTKLQDTLSAAVPGWELRELAPLRRSDVRLAAAHRALDPQRVMDAVDRLGLGPLASRPITLTLLLGHNLSGPTAPTQVSLYASGCLQLCEELNELRHDRGMVGQLTALQRVAVAGRIAAMSVLGGRMDMTTRPVVNSSDSLTVNDLSGGTEGSLASEVLVTAHTVRETFATALFTSSRPGHLRWVHQTYAEYLTAQYLLQSGLSEKKLLALLQQPGDMQGRIALPLREVAAWIAAIRPDIGERIRQQDPAALISAAALPGADEHRSLILGSYLDLEAREDLPYGRDAQLSFYRFTHPGLADQLRQWLTPGQTRRVLWLVARIAVSAQVTELWGAFARLALDPAYPDDVRPQFAHAACLLVPDDQVPALKELLRSDLNGVRGFALERLWPQWLSPDELLAALYAPVVPGLGDSYKHFLWGTPIWDTFPEDALADLVKWLSGPGGGHWIFFGGDRLDPETRVMREAILRRLWRSLRSEEQAEAFLGLVESRLTEGRGLRIPEGETGLVSTDAERRRLLVTAAARFPQLSRLPEFLVLTDKPLVLPQDADWLLDRAASAVGDRPYWLGLCRSLLYTGEMRAALSRRPDLPELQEEMKWRIQLQSAPPEPWMEEMDLEERRWRAEQDARPTYDVRIRDVLRAVQAGTPGDWWVIPDLLHINERSQAVGHDMHHDLRKINGWASLASDLKAGIIATAPAFVLGGLMTGKARSRYAFAAVRALRLLAEEDRAALDALPVSVWAQWAGALVAWPPLNQSGTAADQLLWKLAYAHAPEQMVRRICHEVIAERQGSTAVLDMAGALLGEPLEGAYLSLLDHRRLRPGLAEEVLHTLLLRHLRPAEEKALELLTVPRTIHAKRARHVFGLFSRLPESQSGEDLKEASRPNRLAVAAARALLRQPGLPHWETVFARMQKDGLGEAVLRQGPWVIDPAALGEAQIADLFSWAEAKFPTAQDPVHPPGVGYIRGIGDEIASWRDGLVSELASRATAGAMHALKALQERHPDRAVDLSRAHARAVESYLARMWTPIEPQELRALVSSGQKQLVRDARQLHELVMDSLERLQQDLQGASGAVQGLWDMSKDGAWRPKDENAFSDFVAHHLQRDLEQSGVILNREVEIHRKRAQNGVPGERLDIRVDAVAKHATRTEFRKVSVILEVKGCWNNDLKTAMEEQLIKRYLARETVRDGIYLVGWFLSELWDKEDSRYRRTPKISLEEARTAFSAQAQGLSDKYRLNVAAVVMDARLR